MNFYYFNFSKPADKEDQQSSHKVKPSEHQQLPDLEDVSSEPKTEKKPVETTTGSPVSIPVEEPETTVKAPPTDDYYIEDNTNDYYVEEHSNVLGLDLEIDEYGSIVEERVARKSNGFSVQFAKADPDLPNLELADPIDFATLEGSEVDRVVRHQLDAVTMETSVVYKPDEYGRSKLEVYTQTQEENGDVTLNYDEYFEMHPELVTHKEELKDAETKMEASQSDPDDSVEQPEEPKVEVELTEDQKKGNWRECDISWP